MLKIQYFQQKWVGRGLLVSVLALCTTAIRLSWLTHLPNTPTVQADKRSTGRACVVEKSSDRLNTRLIRNPDSYDHAAQGAWLFQYKSQGQQYLSARGHISMGNCSFPEEMNENGVGSTVRAPTRRVPGRFFRRVT